MIRPSLTVNVSLSTSDRLAKQLSCAAKSCHRISPGEEANELLPDAQNADDNEDPALNEDGCKCLLIWHWLCAIVSHHLYSTISQFI